MVLFPRSGLGRALLFIIVLSTISYLVLNLVSFSGTPWITYVDVPIHFGLWRVCDTSVAGGCSQWSDNTFSTVIVNATFNGGKPGFVRTSQALEIISLIFYVVAAILIFGGIIIGGKIYEFLFGGAALLLFICIVFISATLGVMSVQGRANHVLAFLDWAWWNGLVGLIMTIICFFALILFVIHERFSPNGLFNPSQSKPPLAMQRGFSQNNLWSSPPPPYSLAMGQIFPPIVEPTPFIGQSYNYPNDSGYIQEDHVDQVNQYIRHNYLNQYTPDPMMAYGSQYPPEQYYNNPNPNSNPMMMYGDYYNDGQNYINQSLSPLVSALARQYIWQVADQQYEDQLLEPYQQYINNPYLSTNYF